MILAAAGRSARRFRHATVVAALIVAFAGCGSGPEVEVAEPGELVVALIDGAPLPAIPVEPAHRAELRLLDGSLAAEWQLAVPAETVRAPAGRYELVTYTVFLSDHIQCSGEPDAIDPSSCVRATLGPAQVCRQPVEIVAGRTTRATFQSVRDGLCRLAVEPRQGLTGARPLAG